MLPEIFAEGPSSLSFFVDIVLVLESDVNPFGKEIPSVFLTANSEFNYVLYSDVYEFINEDCDTGETSPHPLSVSTLKISQALVPKKSRLRRIFCYFWRFLAIFAKMILFRKMIYVSKEFSCHDIFSKHFPNDKECFEPSPDIFELIFMKITRFEKDPP